MEVQGVDRWEVTNIWDWVYPFENRNESFALVKTIVNGVTLWDVMPHQWVSGN